MTSAISRPVNWVRRSVDTNVKRTANGLRLIGGLDRPRTGCTPHVVLWREGRATLRRYRAGADGGRPALFLVPSLINRSHIWDLRPGDSFVEGLLDYGYDVFLIDWGTADKRDAVNTMSTYVDEYLPAAYAAATAAAGSSPVVLGHCFGGVIATLWAASTTEQPPALVALGVPTDWAQMGPLAHIVQQGRLEPEDVLDDTGNVPPATMLRAFQMLRPLGDLAGYVTLWDRLDDRRAAQAIWALTDWAHDHVPFPGATFVEMMRTLSRENSLLTGDIVLGDRVRSLKAIKTPFLNVYGTYDHVTPPDSVSPLAGLVGSDQAETLAVKAGHIGLLVGRSARKQTLPAVTEWLDKVGRPNQWRNSQ
ncbi:alpha/beta fold hydrolase [Antrihabitans stalactiti]|uniref:Alpha/beta fold hydrolase n=1 Tax=Antrihabitans stalactiti TaxID=2584121 RepID=A0A848KS55_9NOCA|nr:alpha/beta fold hydrolase [Antrihabitans stalactiti]NMN98407.1 alpha/beta fold hydrolase [Antrihabitans stalactiti]